MRINVTTRNLEADKATVEHIHDRIGRLERYYDGITDVRVVLSNTGGVPESAAEITVSVRRQLLAGQGSAATQVEAFDRGLQRVRRRLQRYKAKLRRTDQDRHR